MKDLISYFECDGAATPGSVMGMGNPAAPDGSTPGSGDTFDHQKRKKKVKPGKEKQEWPDDPETGSGGDRGQLREGLLDDDFGMSDDDLGMGFDKMLEVFIDYLVNVPNITEQQYNNLYTTFKAACAEVQAKTKPDNVSTLKACRGKVYAVVAFYKKTSCSGTPGSGYINGIEIRKFIRNPRPDAVQIAWDPKHHELKSSKRIIKGIPYYEYGVNHPQNINMQLSEWYVVPGEVYGEIIKVVR